MAIWVSQKYPPEMKNNLLGVVLVMMLMLSAAFRPSSVRGLGAVRSFGLFGFPRPLHKTFTVEAATPELINELGVKTWPTWSTQGSEKYITGKKSPLKVYDSNELSFIISGSMEIIDAETGASSLVKAGDFVTFPDGFQCYWFVKETVRKHWYLY